MHASSCALCVPFCCCIARQLSENGASKDAAVAEIDPRVPLGRATHRTTGRAVRHMGRVRACPLCSRTGRCLGRSMQKTARACREGRANAALFCVASNTAAGSHAAGLYVKVPAHVFTLIPSSGCSPTYFQNAARPPFLVISEYGCHVSSSGPHPAHRILKSKSRRLVDPSSLR